MLCRLILIVALVGAPAFAEMVDLEAFGVCVVATSKDDFTDKVQHHYLACASDDFAVGVACYEGGQIISRVVLFQVTGVFLVDNSSVTIKYRFDKDEPFIGEGTAFNNAGRLDGRMRFDETLDGIADSETLVFQLDDETRRLSLESTDGGAAVAELRSRCSP